ncbi:MASE1 domain-containing protein [Leptospira wolffii]|uniref:histidine kinase n=1 Tax=Leptospira wolffii TaxID=409998 RepID=A0ABV5BL06_9LEPT
MEIFRRFMLIEYRKAGTASAKILIVAGVYFALAKIGYSMAAYSEYASPVWPASGLALAAPLLFGKVCLIGVFFGSFYYNYEIKSQAIQQIGAWPFVVEALLIAFGSTLQSYIGSSLFQRFIPKLDLTKNVVYVIRFLWISALVCIVGSTVANFGLFLLGILPLDTILKTWVIWWTGDTLGIFVYFPFFLSWLGPGFYRLKTHSWWESFGIVSLLSFIGAGLFYFFKINSIPVYFPLSYLLITVTVLSSLRFGLRESSLVLILISAIAILGTINGNTPYITLSKEVTLLLLQSFLSAISICSLLVTTVVRERLDTEKKLVRSHKELEDIVRERTKELDRSNRSLGNSEAIYKSLFENVPIAIFECDYSEVKKTLDSLPHMSKKEFFQFIVKNEDFVSRCYESVKVLDANRESIRVFQAKSKEEVIELTKEFFRSGNEMHFRKVLFSIRFGGRILETDMILRTCKGKIFDAAIRWALAPEFESTFGSVIITAMEITGKKQAERQLKTSLREKEVMLKEIHHRVKNNLQVISSLFSLQSEYENDPKIHDAFVESQNRIQTMALIHDELYQSTDLGNVEFSGYSRRLAENIQAAYKIGPEVLLEIDSKTLYLEINIAIPLGLALNELLTNCFKYAFPRDFTPIGGQPKIRVKTALESGSVILKVSDNGIGLPSELNPIETPSFGLTLVQVLTKQLKGKLDFSSSVGSGTDFLIRFDLPN